MPSNEPIAAPKRLLTIQDISCVGQCSATVALPLVSACGVECAALPSAVLSNHTGGFPSWTFRDLTPDMAGIEAEWNKQGIRFDAFYTGYVCEPQIDPILSIMEHCAAPGALRFVDPAMADNGKPYVGFGADFPSKMARLGTPVSDGSSIRYDFNPRLARMAHGTGDVFASVFAGAVLRGLPALDASALAADVVCASIEATPDSHWYGVCFERAIPMLADRLA